MHIIRNKEVHGNLNTELYDVIKNLPDHILHHSEHTLRHPSGVYSVSTKRVFDAFEGFVSLLEDFKTEYESLSKMHKELLDALMAYIDDAYHLMKSLISSTAVTKNIPFAQNWLKAVDNSTKTIVENYQSKTLPYRERLALIVNRIKHEHGRYCHVEARTIFGRVKGYYIEGITQDGTIIPHSRIHPMFKGMHTAISYNRDIKNYLADFYILSHFMAATMHELIQHHYGITLSMNLQECQDDVKIIDLCEKVSNIPDLFFPDESESELTQIILKREEGIIEFQKPATTRYMRSLRRYSNARIQNVLTADGATTKWALPYFKGE
ncbi:hypothetical protein [Bacillus dicomae]|uniref:Uncharacterized protein n=1 Tax=Bacillus dicomae TaxID=3088378 RepID=A0AC61SZK9_9BACI|nr:hypothetical protein [Bacillus dicomae]TPV39565.1 hypothetical protein FJ659_24630 [Bacillus dicomae]